MEQIVVDFIIELLLGACIAIGILNFVKNKENQHNIGLLYQDVNVLLIHLLELKLEKAVREEDWLLAADLKKRIKKLKKVQPKE